MKGDVAMLRRTILSQAPHTFLDLHTEVRSNVTHFCDEHTNRDFIDGWIPRTCFGVIDKNRPSQLSDYTQNWIFPEGGTPLSWYG